MSTAVWIWLAAFALFSILESVTTALVSLWFIAGALAAMIAAICGAAIWLQCILFSVISAVLLLLLRPTAKRFLAPRTVATNADSNIGKIAVVTEAIDDLRGKGAVKIGGVEWTARSVDGACIETGATVRVVRIEGVKVCVKKVEEEHHE